MAAKITRWKPDTCDCVIEYSWDTDDPPETRTHTIVSAEKCPAHAATADLADHWNVVLEENTRKNRVYNFLADHATYGEEITDGGGTYRRLRVGRSMNFTFDSGRNLVLNLTGFTLAERVALRVALRVIDPTRINVL